MNEETVHRLRTIVNECVERCLHEGIRPSKAINEAMVGNEIDSELLRRYLASLVDGWISVIYAFEDLSERRGE